MIPDSLQLESLLASWRARSVDGAEIPEEGREAAVAVVLAPLEDRGPGILMIERAHRPEDPWSGQIGLPGGKRDAEDPDIVATARRETHEEVGVTLPEDSIARFEPVRARRRGAVTNLWVHPVVFRLDEPVPPGISDEVASSRWIPVNHLVAVERATLFPVETGAGPMDFPAVQLESWTLWGLTYRILDDLLGHAGWRLPAGPMPLH